MPIAGSVSPRAETAPVATTTTADIADDVAIWIHPTDPAQSVIIGTNKDATANNPGGGLHVFTLAGTQLAKYRHGTPYNNVDLRYNFPFDGRRITLVAASNRTGTIDCFEFIEDPASPTYRGLVLIGQIATGYTEPYGFGMGTWDSRYWLLVSDNNGNDVRQFEVVDGGSGSVVNPRAGLSPIYARQLSIGSQVEGICVDDDYGVVYIGEEDHALYRASMNPSDTTKTAIDWTGRWNGGAKNGTAGSAGPNGLVEDIEGIAIYRTSRTAGYLLVSNQGSDNYKVYDRITNAFLGTFNIVAGNGIDAVTQTDGLDVTNVALNSTFPAGMFVVHDTLNSGGGANDSSNWKMVSWADIVALSPSDLSIDATYDPRSVGAVPATDAATTRTDLNTNHFPDAAAAKSVKTRTMRKLTNSLAADALRRIIDTPAVKSYVLDIAAPYACRIDSLAVQTATGSATLAVTVDGTAVTWSGGNTTLNATAARTQMPVQPGHASADVPAGAAVRLVVSAVSGSPTDLAVTVRTTRA